jgi:hypothetical protein
MVGRRKRRRKRRKSKRKQRRTRKKRMLIADSFSCLGRREILEHWGGRIDERWR